MDDAFIPAESPVDAEEISGEKAAQLIVAGTPGKVAFFRAIASLAYVAPTDPFYTAARMPIDRAVDALSDPPRDHAGRIEYMARVVMLEPGLWQSEGAVIPDPVSYTH